MFVGRKSGFNPNNIPTMPKNPEKVATYNNNYNKKQQFGKYYEPYVPGPKNIKVKMKTP